MSWVLNTTAVEDADPVASYYIQRIAEKIRECYDQLDAVIVTWRRGSTWIPAPVSISMPTEKKIRSLATPEAGARQVWQSAFAFAQEKHATHLAFVGLGSSTTDQSAKQLFRLAVKPFDGSAEDEQKSMQEKTQSVAIDAAKVLIDALECMGRHLEAGNKREVNLLDKCDALVGKNTATTETLLHTLAFERQMKKEHYEHEERMQDMKDTHDTTDSILDMVGKPVASALERFLAKAFGLDEAAFNGKTFASRLAAIVQGVGRQPDGNARLQRAHDIIGADGWEVLKAMSNAKTDEDFVAVGKKFIELLGPNPNDKFKKIAAELGEGPAMALLQLIADSGLAA